MPRKYTRCMPLRNAHDSCASGMSALSLAASIPRAEHCEGIAANPNPGNNHVIDKPLEPATPLASVFVVAARNTHVPVAALQDFLGTIPLPDIANVATLVPVHGIARAALPPVSISLTFYSKNKISVKD